MKIIAVISNVMLVYKKKKIGKLLYSCYSICKLSWNAIFTFCVLIISQNKKKQMMLYDEKRIQSVKKYG